MNNKKNIEIISNYCLYNNLVYKILFDISRPKYILSD